MAEDGIPMMDIIGILGSGGDYHASKLLQSIQQGYMEEHGGIDFFIGVSLLAFSSNFLSSFTLL
ncbi:predicted protein [Sclerotinia sclerotiorum 1980 UF-70]|uniref:Uncharacterized protein n=1 Tax=Sclerotinia sclerotiorum (strain ATCC 18683 / 1980 / Ss-1) TaxID=665079 RepID=A7EXF4_SCLS1|nr:predicted protein [Sclerotinia sclerotiorum 1980 UF-70]EDN94146.1 predicted protein [Sclerotinia sclerotiorum 1980 UF-70]